MKLSPIFLALLVVGCRDVEELVEVPEVALEQRKEPEMVVMARKRVESRDTDSGRELAHLLINVIEPGMTQDEVVEAIGTTDWIEDCRIQDITTASLTYIESGFSGAPDRIPINAYNLEFGADRQGGHWGLTFGLIGEADGTKRESVVKFFRGEPCVFSSCPLHEFSIYYLSKDRQKMSSLIREKDGGIRLVVFDR